MTNTPLWKLPTRQVQGRITERRIMHERGGRAHPNSGANHIKDDGSDDHNIYEIKDARISHTLKMKDLKSLAIRAAQQGKNAKYIVQFDEVEIECAVRIKKR